VEFDLRWKLAREVGFTRRFGERERFPTKPRRQEHHERPDHENGFQWEIWATQLRVSSPERDVLMRYG
jgi:hypothetical protein